MVLSIVLGGVAGILGFLPLLFSLRLTKKTPQTSVFGSMSILLLGLLVSFLVIFVLAICFIVFDRPNAFSFVISEVIVLSASAIVYGVKRNLSE